MSAVAESGLVLNPGGGEPNMASEKASGLGTTITPPSVPNLSLPQPTMFHMPLSMQSLTLPKGMDVNTSSKIPSLMDIRPSVTVFPTPQRIPIQTPQQNVHLPIQGTGPGPVENNPTSLPQRQIVGPSPPIQSQHKDNRPEEGAQEESGYVVVCVRVSFFM